MSALRRYLARMKGGGRAPARPPRRDLLLAGTGGCLAIAAVAWLSLRAGVPALMAPLGASCFLAFAVPDSPLAQPRHIVGGHLVASAVGLAVLQVCGGAWWAQALAVGLAISAMLATRTGHPPAGADPLLVFALQPGWDFLLAPVLPGSLVVALVALAFNNLRPQAAYPKYW